MKRYITIIELNVIKLTVDEIILFGKSTVYLGRK